jgi:hypothetical protein
MNYWPNVRVGDQFRYELNPIRLPRWNTEHDSGGSGTFVTSEVVAVSPEGFRVGHCGEYRWLVPFDVDPQGKAGYFELVHSPSTTKHQTTAGVRPGLYSSCDTVFSHTTAIAVAGAVAIVTLLCLVPTINTTPVETNAVFSATLHPSNVGETPKAPHQLLGVHITTVIQPAVIGLALCVGLAVSKILAVLLTRWHRDSRRGNKRGEDEV